MLANLDCGYFRANIHKGHIWQITENNLLISFLHTPQKPEDYIDV